MAPVACPSLRRHGGGCIRLVGDHRRCWGKCEMGSTFRCRTSRDWLCVGHWRVVSLRQQDATAPHSLAETRPDPSREIHSSPGRNCSSVLTSPVRRENVNNVYKPK